jgi:large exoprotein involved in heme utilization and adhesion
MTGEDFLTGIQAVTTSSAPGGNIQVTTGSLELEHMGSIFTTSYPNARGTAGTIDINAQSVNLRSGGIITAETQGAGKGGNVQITSETLRIDGHDTSITAVTKNTASPAPGGNIQITAGSIDLDHMGSVSTTSFGPGPGGNIEVSSRDLTLANGATIRAAGEATGPAGKISVGADRDIVLTGNSAISTSALKSSGGDIRVKAGDEIQLVSSEFNAQAGPGGGGNITVLAPSQVYLLDGTFTAQAVGDGGNLTIMDPVFFILNNSALISKSSSANGGNITILSDFFFQSDSIIDASAPFGLPGTVSVSAPEVDLSGSLVGLPGSLLDAEALLRPDCGVRLTGNISSFIVLGRGGLPIAPGGFVPSGTAPPADETK